MAVSVSAVNTKRIMCDTMSHQQKLTANTRAFMECDTNADICCLGRSFIVSQYIAQIVDVYAYSGSYAPIENVPIVTEMDAYNDTTTGQTCILFFNESLYY